MYKYILIIMLTGCSQISIQAGMSFNDEQGGQPEIANFPPPLGILRFEYETDSNSDIFCEHISSIPNAEIGYGLNHCGVLFKFD